MYGPTAFMCSYCKGVNHVVVGDTQLVADLVPVDFVVNGTLLSAMKTAHDFATRRDSLVYDSDSGNSTDIGMDIIVINKTEYMQEQTEGVCDKRGISLKNIYGVFRFRAVSHPIFECHQ